MQVEAFFDETTATLSYVVHDTAAGVGVVIDPLLDFDPRSGRTASRSCDALAAFLVDEGLRVPYVLDTHAHADHWSGLPYFKERFGARSAIGARIVEVQRSFRDLYNLGEDFAVQGSEFDLLLEDGQVLEAGPLRIQALHTPGHTPACLSYRIGDAVFVGDALFMPDYGTARCDFPGGSAAALYDSIQRLYALPDTTRIFTCHDYRPGGRALRYESSIGEQKRENVQLDQTTTKQDFVEFRKKRDAGLSAPALMLAVLQVNIRAGESPAPEANGVSYLKIPLNRL